MSGLQEILVVVVIVLAVILIPRMRGQQGELERTPRPAFRLTGRMRLAIAASVVYPALIAALLKPWRNDPVRFVYFGIGPVALAWLLYWVVAGFKKKAR